MNIVPLNVQPRMSIQEFHNNNIKDGFQWFDVNLQSNNTKGNQSFLDAFRNLDRMANPSDNKGRLIKHQPKPYIKYVAKDRDGNKIGRNGGFFLWAGYEESSQKPIFFRVKCAVKNANVDNFSVQVQNVFRIYWKPPESNDVLNLGNGLVVVKSRS